MRDQQNWDFQRTREIPLHIAPPPPPSHRRTAVAPPRAAPAPAPRRSPRRSTHRAPDQEGFNPPNVVFGTSTPVTPARRRAPSRKRRYIAAGAMLILMVSAFAVGNRIADITAVAAGPDRIQSAALPMADGAAAEPATSTSCHPAYIDCIPHDLVNDFDCEDLGITDVRLQDVNWDPYELDRNGDGIGCEST